MVVASITLAGIGRRTLIQIKSAASATSRHPAGRYERRHGYRKDGGERLSKTALIVWLPGPRRHPRRKACGCSAKAGDTRKRFRATVKFRFMPCQHYHE